MAISDAIKDRQFQSFVEVEGGKTARRVLVANSDAQAIPVFNTGSGLASFEYGEINLAVGATVNAISIVVGVEKEVTLARVEFSGTSLGKFKAIVNTQTVGVKRTWWASFNAAFDLGGLKLSEGDTARIEVENIGEQPGEFNCSLFYFERDL